MTIGRHRLRRAMRTAGIAFGAIAWAAAMSDARAPLQGEAEMATTVDGAAPAAIPPLDAARPATVSKATFALG